MCEWPFDGPKNVFSAMTYKSILCLSGELPQKDFFEKMQLPVIAADGAANKLHALGITPHIVIGDLDSVCPSLNVNRLHIHDQSRCDYEKSMEYLEQNGLLPTIILGSSGGDLDHILNNISIFMLNSHGNLLYAPPLYGTILSPPSNPSDTAHPYKSFHVGFAASTCCDPRVRVGFNRATAPFPRF